jgi:molybdopterin molybdotransferase
VRRRGEDLRAGEVALPAGTRVGAAEAACLASFGRVEVAVHRRPRVAILSTGDELVAAGEPLAPGKIHDSNGPGVAAAVLEAGGVPLPLGIARDDAAALRALLVRGLEADVLVTTAGVSMGDRDLVRQELRALGVEERFWKVEVKPGHPTAFGTRGATLVFSLPGNPVSTLVLFEELVRPALLALQGHARPLRPLVPAVLDERLPHRGGRVTFSRVVLERRGGTLHARSAGSQETGIFRTLLRADGLAVLPPDRADAPAGAVVPVQVLRPDLEAGALAPAPPADG